MVTGSGWGTTGDLPPPEQKADPKLPWGYGGNGGGTQPMWRGLLPSGREGGERELAPRAHREVAYMGV